MMIDASLLLPFFLALAASLLTFFSGFGLGTILLPVFLVYAPPGAPQEAVLAVALVHITNNVLKGGLTFQWVEWKTAGWFGVSSMLGAFVGAWMLDSLSDAAAQRWIGLTLVVFSLFEWLPQKAHRKVEPKTPPFYVVGGLLSGFAGGASGHQGALRSYFLLRTGWSAQRVIATGTMVALAVDITRIPMYLSSGHGLSLHFLRWCVAGGMGALLGSLVGRKLLPKLTLKPLQIFVALGLAILGIRLLWVSYL